METTRSNNDAPESQPGAVMSSGLGSLVVHKFDSHHDLPQPGARGDHPAYLAADIYGHGSDLSTLCGLPTGANKHNYRQVVVSGIPKS